MVYFSCFDLAKKDKDTLIRSIENETHRMVLQNLEYLDSEMAESKKFRRRLDEMTAEQFNDYARKLSQSKYDILRAEPKLVKLIRQIHEDSIDIKEYPYIDKPKQAKK